MSRKLEQELEKKIAQAAIAGLLANGWLITVNDDDQGYGDDVIVDSTDADAIVAKMFTTDGELLKVRKSPDPDPTVCDGWVRFIWGNAQDCLSDYTTKLEADLKAANDLAEKYQ